MADILMPPHDAPFKAKDVRDLYRKGTWAYALGKPAWTHPKYKQAVDIAKRGRKGQPRFNPWWIRNWGDVEGVLSGCWMDEQNGRQVANFYGLLRHFEGDLAGRPFLLADWQLYDITIPVFGWMRPNGTRRFRQAYVEIPKKQGKALALDTPIPTVTGWKRMQDIHVGDVLFDEVGNQCHVRACTEEMHGHECYRVIFSDRTEVIADADHLWLVYSRKPDRKKQSLFTTKQMASRTCISYTGSEGSNFSIPICGPLQSENIELPLDPYVLGAWLGDGISEAGSIVCSNADKFIVEEIERRGFSLSVRNIPKDKAPMYGINFPHDPKRRPKSILSILRLLNLVKNKHIPDAYLWAGTQQRRDLLCGLMDTDGYISADGQCEFTTIKPVLSDGVVQLLRSLGYKPLATESRAVCNGKDCGIKYRIKFYAFNGDRVFRLERKHARMRNACQVKQRSKTRHIVSIEKTASVPVRCIEVDSPSHLYLCGDGMIPTHNTTWAAGTQAYMLVGDGENGAENYTAATDREQSGVMFRAFHEMAMASPSLSKILEFVPSRYRIVYHPTASFYRSMSSKSSSAHGLKPYFIGLDETHVFPNPELYDALLYGGRSRRQPLVMSFTTAGIYDPTSLGWRLHEQAERVRNGEAYTDWSFFAYICGLTKDEETEWHTPAMCVKTSPSVGITFTLDDDQEVIKRIESDPAEQSNAQRLLRNIWTAQQHAWMPMDKWAACAGEYTEDDLADGVCYGGLDCSLLRDITALILWFPPQKDWTRHRFLCRFWVPEAGVPEFDVEYSGMYSTWIKAGKLLATPGETIDQGEIHAELQRLRERYEIRTIGYDRAFAQNLAQNLEADGFDVGPFGQGVQAVNEPTLKLMELVLNGELEHPNHPVMNWHISNCQAALRNGLLRLVKNSSGGRGKAQVRYKIDGAHAAVMALGTSLLDEVGIFDVAQLIR